MNRWARAAGWFGTSWCCAVQRQEQAVLPISAVKLRGRHNLLNVAAACAIGAAVA